MKVKKVAADFGVGIAVTIGLLAVLELVLWIAGIGDPAGRAYLTRGFDPGAAYLVPVDGQDGAWRTQFLAGRETERVIPKKGEKLRLLLFGGSNTNGFPVPFLLEKLNAGLDPARYEVFNLGCNGYGSARVSVLFHQAVEFLSPDIVLIYVGHNEFIERSFQMDVERAASSGAMQALTDLASRTRTFNALVAAFAKRHVSTKKTPEAWTFEHEKFKGLTYDETQRYFASYTENLRGMCRDATERGIGVVLCTVIHNRFSAPFESSFPEDMSAADQARFEALRSQALELMPEFLAPLLPLHEDERVHAFDWDEKPGPKDRAPPGILPGMRECTGPLANLDPMLPNEARWSPKVKTLYESLALVHQRALDAGQRERLERASGGLQEALKLCPDHPRALFELALSEYVLGRESERVQQLFDRAGRFDRAPRKGNGATNDRVREVAKEFPEVLFLDADRLFAERVPLGLVGWEQMLDHCHLNGGARRVLMTDMAAAIRERFPPSSTARR